MSFEPLPNPLTSPRQFPTVLERTEMEKMIDSGTKGAHESLLRSYHVLKLVEGLLEKKVDHDVILNVIRLNTEG